MINLAGIPHIISLNWILSYKFDFIDYLSNDLKAVQKIAEQIFASKEAKKKEQKKPRRLLSSAHANPQAQNNWAAKSSQDDGVKKPFFGGDVVIMPKIDSSYTSYQGAPGTAGNEISANLKMIPMNTTMTFP